MYKKNGCEIAPENHFVRHPVEDIEPELTREEILRDGALKLLRAVNAAFAHLEATLYRPNTTLPEVRLAFWQVAFPLGVTCCDGSTMTQKSIECGKERATISKFATTFCRAQNIPRSEYMKNEDAAESYAKARIKSIRCNQKS